MHNTASSRTSGCPLSQLWLQPNRLNICKIHLHSKIGALHLSNGIEGCENTGVHYCWLFYSIVFTELLINHQQLLTNLQICFYFLQHDKTYWKTVESYGLCHRCKELLTDYFFKACSAALWGGCQLALLYTCCMWGHSLNWT